MIQDALHLFAEQYNISEHELARFALMLAVEKQALNRKIVERKQELDVYLQKHALYSKIAEGIAKAMEQQSYIIAALDAAEIPEEIRTKAREKLSAIQHLQKGFEKESPSLPAIELLQQWREVHMLEAQVKAVSDIIG